MVGERGLTLLAIITQGCWGKKGLEIMMMGEETWKENSCGAKAAMDNCSQSPFFHSHKLRNVWPGQ